MDLDILKLILESEKFSFLAELSIIFFIIILFTLFVIHLYKVFTGQQSKFWVSEVFDLKKKIQNAFRKQNNII